MPHDALHSSPVSKLFHKTPKYLLILILLLVVLIVLLFIAAFFIDEPLRRYTESQANKQLKGYTVRIPELSFHPLSLSITLSNMSITQQKHPDPPVATIGRAEAGIHWRSILSGMLVGDMEIDRPVLHINLAQLREEQKQPEQERKEKWQKTLEALHPLTVNAFTVNQADVTYVDQDLKRPLRVSDLNINVSNIRNRPSEGQQFPSPFHIDAKIFKTGSVTIDGHANFLAEPTPLGEVKFSLQGVDLSHLRPILARSNINLTRGTMSANGEARATADEKIAHLAQLTIDKLKVDYVQTETKAAQKSGEPSAEKAKELQKPGLLLRLDRLSINDSEVGLINRAVSPDYRAFLSDMNLVLTNLSNKFTRGPAKLNMTGKFMGSGTTKATATFRPEKTGPDFDINLSVYGTEMKSMNDIFRAYGNFDVVAGKFSFYSEMRMKDNRVDGYVKPLFRDMDVYDRRQDKEKSLFRKMYEGLIGGIAGLLENKPQESVATTTDISGPMENPQVSTWQTVINLFRNAFIKAILPGFEQAVREGGSTEEKK